MDVPVAEWLNVSVLWVLLSVDEGQPSQRCSSGITVGDTDFASLSSRATNEIKFTESCGGWK